MFTGGAWSSAVQMHTHTHTYIYIYYLYIHDDLFVEGLVVASKRTLRWRAPPAQHTEFCQGLFIHDLHAPCPCNAHTDRGTPQKCNWPDGLTIIHSWSLCECLKVHSGVMGNSSVSSNFSPLQCTPKDSSIIGASANGCTSASWTKHSGACELH